MEPTMAGSSLQGIAEGAREAHEHLRDKGPVSYELDRVAELTDVLHVRLAQVEDRLGPIRSPLDTITTVVGSEPAKPVSEVADRLRSCTFSIERAIARVDQMLSDIEL